MFFTRLLSNSRNLQGWLSFSVLRAPTPFKGVGTIQNIFVYMSGDKAITVYGVYNNVVGPQQPLTWPKINIFVPSKVLNAAYFLKHGAALNSFL